jgi:hypothetical protein
MDSTYKMELGPEITSKLPEGLYSVIIQHPMYNDKFDIYPDSQKITVLGKYPSQNSILFKLEGPGSVRGSDATSGLIEAINNPAIDDTYTKLTFLIEQPVININIIGEREVGDKFLIKGSTNLPVDSELLVEVTSSSFKPTSGTFSGATGTVKVLKGTGDLNSWSFPIDSTSFKPDEYNVQVSQITGDKSVSTRFSLVG